jgi:hypothetical protein
LVGSELWVLDRRANLLGLLVLGAGVVTLAVDALVA